MAQQIKSKYIGADQIDGSKIKLGEGQAIRATDSTSAEVDLIKLGASNEVLIKGQEAATKVQVDAAQAAADAAQVSADQGITDAQAAQASADAAQADATQALADAATAQTAADNAATAAAAAQADVDAVQASIGQANGIASLDASGLIPSTQLPSYVDDVLEFADLATFPATGDAGKIYVALDTNKTYRWSGSAYVYITSGAVDSVNGQTGVVSLDAGDIGISAISGVAATDVQGALAELAGDITANAGANKTLSNLEAPTAVNQDILPDATANVRNIGSTSSVFGNIYGRRLRTKDSSDNEGLFISSQGRTQPDGVQAAHAIETMTSGVANTLGVFTANGTASAQLTVMTGNGTSGNSGDLIFKTGTATSTRGKIVLNSNLVETTTSIVPSLDGGANLGASGKTFSQLYISGSLLRANGTKILDTGNSTLNDTSDLTSVAYGSRILYSAAGTGMLNWSSTDLSVGANLNLNGNNLTNVASITNASADLEIIAGAANGVYIHDASENNYVWVDNSVAEVYSNGNLTLHSQTGEINLNGFTGVNVNSKVIKNVADAVATNDAVNKGQLDVVASSASAAQADATQALADAAAAQADATQALADAAALDTRVDALEAVVAPVWAKYKRTLDATDITNQYIDLPHLAVANSVTGFVDRLAIHEGAAEDYTLSTVGGVTRLTFLNDIATGGPSAMVVGDSIYVKYVY